MPKQNLNSNRSIDRNEQETFRTKNEPATKLKNNNLTASFKQEDLDNLEKEDKRPFFGQNSAIGGQFDITDLDASRNMLRDDLDNSNIEDGEDIQRSKHNDDELNFTDMTVSNNDIDGRDPNDQSLSLNQLENS